MAVIETTSFIIIASFGGIVLLRMINEARKSLCTIILNVMFGGALFVILNIMGANIAVNLITGIIITFLGVPGVALIVLLKIIFHIF